MRLRLKRSQRMSGMLGKTAVFSLEARVDITEEEIAHIKKYKMGQEVLYAKERIAGSSEAKLSSIARNLASAATALTVRIDDLVRGTKVECKDILDMMDVEDQIVSACKTFKSILASMAHFDGEEVIELS